MTSDPKLSAAARAVFRDADNGKETIHIPCIVLFELTYLVEKKKVQLDIGAVISKVQISSNYHIEPMCAPIVQQSRAVPRNKVPDPWDRLIAATSIHLALPLVTRDRALRNLGIKTVW